MRSNTFQVIGEKGGEIGPARIIRLLKHPVKTLTSPGLLRGSVLVSCIGCILLVPLVVIPQQTLRSVQAKASTYLPTSCRDSNRNPAQIKKLLDEIAQAPSEGALNDL